MLPRCPLFRVFTTVPDEVFLFLQHTHKGAVDELNSMPYYAELCSAMLAVTYSNGHSQGDRMVVSFTLLYIQ